ncbi:uncharacterized protein TNIN_1791 [Trichonephila inaurata madagascariensis]|uniref:Uncharacterized protein n=1 Tax=Trichonephila inaurata madagascariensis TaxID=2747483 RepID=A0A8X6WSJ2_9ARAC|nr:uncharacterized protein TNIN_1791 [Trichonephila inaurata madagascariensis]
MNELEVDSLVDVSLITNEGLEKHLTIAQQKLYIANRQIGHLDSQINYLRKLFRRAEKNNGHAVRYNLRMQLSISSGVKVMYHHYAAYMEHRIATIRAKINESSSSSPTPEETINERI